MGGSVGGKIPGFATSLSATLLPTVSQFSGGDDFSRIQTLYIRSFRLITVISAALTITAVSFAHQTLLFWLNADFAAKAANLLVILAFTNFLLALFGPLSNFLFGLGKLKFLSIASISMAVLNVIFLVLLLPRYGITGAAYAYLFSVLPIIYIFYYVEHHYLRLSERREYYLRTAAGVLYTSIIMYVVNLSLAKLISSLPTLLIIGGTSFLLYILTYKILGFFNTEDWRHLPGSYSKKLA
jgi:O-antigen/teichoic acid export membrane protein